MRCWFAGLQYIVLVDQHKVCFAGWDQLGMLVDVLGAGLVWSEKILYYTIVSTLQVLINSPPPPKKKLIENMENKL